MAEALAAVGAVASIAQLADFGFQLSVKLFAFGEAIANADQSVKSLANEISLTATVLHELDDIIKSNEARVSPKAVENTEKTIRECFAVFKQLSGALEKSVGNVSVGQNGSDRRKLGRMEKIKWSFYQPRMDLLRSNLDRLKSSLTLMLQVLAYAESIERREATTQLEYQKCTIEGLARSAKSADVKYQALRRSVKDTARDDQANEPLSREPAVIARSADARSQADGPISRAPAAVTRSRNLRDQANELISRAQPFVTRSAQSHSLDESSASTPRGNSRSFDAASSHVGGTRGESIDTAPRTVPGSDNKPLIGELILCFNLVHNLLSDHLGVASNPSAYKTYLTLRRSVEAAHEAELDLLEEEHGTAAYAIGAEAAKNAVLLQKKLRELAQQKHNPMASTYPRDDGHLHVDRKPRRPSKADAAGSVELSEEDAQPHRKHRKSRRRHRSERLEARESSPRVRTQRISLGWPRRIRREAGVEIRERSPRVRTTIVEERRRHSRNPSGIVSERIVMDSRRGSRGPPPIRRVDGDDIVEIIEEGSSLDDMPSRRPYTPARKQSYGSDDPQGVLESDFYDDESDREDDKETDVANALLAEWTTLSVPDKEP